MGAKSKSEQLEQERIMRLDLETKAATTKEALNEERNRRELEEARRIIAERQLEEAQQALKKLEAAFERSQALFEVDSAVTGAIIETTKQKLEETLNKQSSEDLEQLQNQVFVQAPVQLEAEMKVMDVLPAFDEGGVEAVPTILDIQESEGNFQAELIPDDQVYEFRKEEADATDIFGDSEVTDTSCLASSGREKVSCESDVCVKECVQCGTFVGTQMNPRTERTRSELEAIRTLEEDNRQHEERTRKKREVLQEEIKTNVTRLRMFLEQKMLEHKMSTHEGAVIRKGLISRTREFSKA